MDRVAPLDEDNQDEAECLLERPNPSGRFDRLMRFSLMMVLQDMEQEVSGMAR